VLRAGREIQLSSFGFIDRSEPRHRWWGMEIRFEPALDHVFGITNNKQEVRNLRRFDEAEIEALHETKESEDDFTSAEIDFKLKLNDRISEHISQCMGIIRGRREGTRTSATRNPIVEVVNMEVSADGSQTISAEESSNKEISTKLEERKTLLLVDDETLTEGEAVELAEKTIDYRIDVQTGAWPGDLFLDNRLAANAAVAVINREHPFYDHFWNYLEQETDTKGFEALEVLLMAYCRAEDELAVRIDRKHFEAFRNRWGSWVRQLIGHSGS